MDQTVSAITKLGESLLCLQGLIALIYTPFSTPPFSTIAPWWTNVNNKLITFYIAIKESKVHLLTEVLEFSTSWNFFLLLFNFSVCRRELLCRWRPEDGPERFQGL